MNRNVQRSIECISTLESTLDDIVLYEINLNLNKHEHEHKSLNDLFYKIFGCYVHLLEIRR